jgi:hypothetical protein
MKKGRTLTTLAVVARMNSFMINETTLSSFRYFTNTNGNAVNPRYPLGIKYW